jgi:hypothetical protein
LYRAVNDCIQKGQARRPAGAPPLRVVVFYLVRKDGTRTMHEAQAALRPLGLAEQQRALQPEDDVSAIVAGR